MNQLPENDPSTAAIDLTHSKELLSYALFYASLGWPVFPLYEALLNGSCACGKKCASPGKHPRTSNGVKAASTDPDQIRQWWKQWPMASIGLRTGKCSHLCVFDVDARKGGDATLAGIEGIDWSKFPFVARGEGGHIYTRIPMGVAHIGNRANFLPGIDIRGESGYVVAAPSRHVSGDQYTWMARPETIDDVPFIPKEFLDDLVSKKAEASPPPNLADEPEWLKAVPHASRMAQMRAYLKEQQGDDKSQQSQTWNVVCGAVRGLACRNPEQAIAAIMEDYNPRCEPPWPRGKIKRKVSQAYGKAELPEWGSLLKEYPDPIGDYLDGRGKDAAAKILASEPKDIKTVVTAALKDVDCLRSLAQLDELEFETFLEETNLKGVPRTLGKLLKKAVKNAADESNRERQEDTRKQQKHKNLDGMQAMKEAVAGTDDGDVTDEEAQKLQQYALLQKGNNFSLFDFGRKRYSTIKIAKELNIAIQRMWRDTGAPLEFWYEGADGNFKEKTADRLMRDYGTLIEGMSYDLSIEKSVYDPQTRTLSLATCPLRSLSPLEDPQIDKWLRLIGGKHADTMTRWLATVMRQDALNCCLFIVGSPGIGKSLLTAGLARLWRKAGPCELEHVVGRFNDDLLGCPLVVLDEGVKNPDVLKGLSNHIRSLIGNKDRLLNAKFLSGVQIHGGLRLMITANNTKVLDMLASEDMGEDDINAIADRLFIVEAGDDAARYLNTLKEADPEITSKWIEEDRIARHILHLRDTVPVKNSGRFLVMGQKTNLHSELAMRNPEMSVVLEWVTKFVLAPDKLARSETNEPGARVGNDRILIHPNVVREQWTTYMGDEFRPSRDAIIRHLKANARKIQCRVNGKRFYEINADRIVDYATSRFLAEKDELKRLINQDNDLVPIARGSSSAGDE